MSRIRKTDTERKCPECSGIIHAGERRCPCYGKVRLDGPRKYPSDLQEKHFYRLFESIRTGSWAHVPGSPTGGGSELSIVYDGKDQSFSVRRRSRQPIPVNEVEIDYFIFRCELAIHYWRDERARLMGARMELWAAGIQQQKVCDCLGINRDSLRWLDREIRKFVWFPARARLLEGEYWKFRRAIKSGVANDIIRRWQHGYKQTQTLEAQQDASVKTQEAVTYERGIHVEVGAGSDSEGAKGAGAGA